MSKKTPRDHPVPSDHQESRVCVECEAHVDRLANLDEMEILERQVYLQH